MRKLLITALTALAGSSFSHEIHFISVSYMNDNQVSPCSYEYYLESGIADHDFFYDIDGMDVMAGAGCHANIHGSGDGAVEAQYDAYFKYTFEWIPDSRSDVPGIGPYTVGGNRYHKTHLTVYNEIHDDEWNEDWDLMGFAAVLGTGGPWAGTAHLEAPNMYSDWEDFQPSGVGYETVLSDGGTWYSDGFGSIGDCYFSAPDAYGHIYGTAYVLINEAPEAETDGYASFSYYQVTSASVAQSAKYHPTTLAGVTIYGS